MKIKHFLLFLCIAFAACTKHFSVQKTAQQHYALKEEAADSSLIKLIAPYKQSLDGKMNEVIGYAPVALTKKVPESNLGDFFAEAIYDKVKTLDKVDTSITVCIFNNGGLRTSVPQGNVTVGGMFELMPFENKLVLIKISGVRLKKLLDLIAEKDGAPETGLRFVIENKKAENISVHGLPFDTAKAYIIATSDYLAGGGDKFFSPEENNEMVKTELLLRDILIGYCRKETLLHKQIGAQTDGRIQYGK